MLFFSTSKILPGLIAVAHAGGYDLVVLLSQISWFDLLLFFVYSNNISRLIVCRNFWEVLFAFVCFLLTPSLMVSAIVDSSYCDGRPTSAILQLAYLSRPWLGSSTDSLQRTHSSNRWEGVVMWLWREAAKGGWLSGSQSQYIGRSRNGVPWCAFYKSKFVTKTFTVLLFKIMFLNNVLKEWDDLRISRNTWMHL